jgi:hypothetical protein
MGKKTKRRIKGEVCTLMVRVNDTSEDPIDRIQVQLRDGLESIATGVTDGDGEVFFRGLERDMTVSIWVNDENTGVEIELKKASDEITVEYEGEYEPVEDEGDEDEDADSSDSEEDLDTPKDSDDFDTVI